MDRMDSHTWGNLQMQKQLSGSHQRAFGNVRSQEFRSQRPSWVRGLSIASGSTLGQTNSACRATSGLKEGPHLQKGGYPPKI